MDQASSGTGEMGCGAVNENCFQESPKFSLPEVRGQCNNPDGSINGSLQQNVDSDNGNPPVKNPGCDIETTGAINPSADGSVHDEPVLMVTPEWQRRSWQLEVSQSAEDNPESVNSDNESDGGSWTFEDGPDANLKIHELQIQNMTRISEALEERARKAEKEQSDNDKAFKEQLNDTYFKHAKSMQAQQDQWDAERAEALQIRKELIRENGQLQMQYHGACKQIKDQTEKINDLDTRISGYIEVLKLVKAPDGSIYTHKERQNTVDDLKRDANAQKEFYKNQIKTLENQVARKVARLNKGTEESRNLQHKLQALSTELSDEQQKFRDAEAKLELERKSHVDMEETSKKDFEARAREAQVAIARRDEQIRHMDDIIRNYQVHLATAQRSYAAAMDTAANFHRAHEKSSQENRELVRQHRRDMEAFVNDHNLVCDNHSKTEAVLKEEIVMLKTKILSMANSNSYDRSPLSNASVNSMRQEILSLRADLAAAKDMSVKRDKHIALPPGNTPKEQIGGSWAPEALDALAEAQANAMGMRLDKGKRIADDIVEKRSREAAKGLAERPGSEFSKLQATFRKGMAEVEMDQGTKTEPTSKTAESEQPSQPSKPTPTAVHSDQYTQPSKPKPTPVIVHSDKSNQPSQQPKPASAPMSSVGQPPKVPTTSKIPIPAKAQPENQVKGTPPVEAPPAYSRSFSIPPDASYWMRSHYAPPVIVSSGVPVSSADVERSRPVPIPIAKEQKPAAQGNNQA
ncbi:hypothetical protein VE00_01338 [Pseudogymnoascus sp. WSF 3629]|nr:hypothetical protein VE00_01338 [Pseudogymnoascus sp. WSF 3629]